MRRRVMTALACSATVTLRAGASGNADYELLGRLDLAAGRYRLRLAAYNPSLELTGAVFTDVIVPDFTNDPFSVSGLMLTESPARASAPKDALAPIVPIVPTADRTFAHDAKATAFVRLYQSGRKSITTADVSIRILNEQGGVDVSTKETVDASRFATTDAVAQAPALTGPVSAGHLSGFAAPSTNTKADPFANAGLRSADIRYTIPLATLAPGAHLLTIDVTVDDKQIRRNVVFRVR